MFTAGSGKGVQVRLDKQTFVLPIEFRDQTLTNIRIIDTGLNDTVRTLVYGVTVSAVPERICPARPVPQQTDLVRGRWGAANRERGLH